MALWSLPHCGRSLLRPDRKTVGGGGGGGVVEVVGGEVEVGEVGGGKSHWRVCRVKLENQCGLFKVFGNDLTCLL